MLLEHISIWLIYTRCRHVNCHDNEHADTLKIHDVYLYYDQDGYLFFILDGIPKHNNYTSL